MAAFVAKIISKRILGEKLENKFGTEDPYFEHVPATRLDGTPTGKLKKRKKALPPGISEKDGKILTKVKRRAYRLDMALFSFMGIRFGWGSVLGIIPAFGDALDAFMALMVYKTCAQIEGGLPSALKTKMMLNIIVDFFIGLVPFVGDIADAAFRANTRNALLLEQHLRERGQENLRKSGLPIPDIDPSDPREFDRLQREGQESGTTQQPGRHSSRRQPQRTASTQQPQQDRPSYEPTAPEAAQVRDDRRERRWFGRSNPRPHDVEAAAGRDPREKLQRTDRR
ncbi:putative membrane protein [Paramyrothecium foliicola]|nr:putative membrane protein [Paramyrothecium foliicola]